MDALSLSDFEKLSDKSPKVRFGFARRLLKTARTHPELVYPYWDTIVLYLHHKNQVLVWTAIDLLGLMARVDTDHKANAYVDAFIRLLAGGKLITANHAIFALTCIAKANPAQKEKILPALLSAGRQKYETTECSNIVTGKTIEALSELMPEPEKEVMSFIKQASANTRHATANKAAKLLKKYQGREKNCFSL